MADEEKRLPEEEAEHPPETDVSSDSKEPSFDAHAPETLEDGQPDSGDTQPDHMEKEDETADEDNTIAGRRIKGFQLDLGKQLEEIPDYTLHEDAGKIRSKRRKSAFARVMIGIIIVGISALLSMFIIFGAQDAFGFGKADRVIAFEVPQDATVTDVAALLEEKGVINSSFLFRVYYKLNSPEGSFHYGTYTLNSNMSYSDIISELFKYGASREEDSVTFL